MTQKQENIVTYIDNATAASYSAMQSYFPKWQKTDKLLCSYIDPRDKRIVFPYTYALVQSVSAYIASAFLRDPIFEFVGVSPEDTIGAALMEKVIQVHAERFKVGLAIDKICRHALAYGFGCGVVSWQVKERMRTKAVDVPMYSPMGEVMGVTKQKIREPFIMEGNSLVLVDPYEARPDPNCPIENIQDGEFFYWVEKTNLSAVQRTAHIEGYSNLDRLYDLAHRKANQTIQMYPTDRNSQDGYPRDSSETTPVELLKGYHWIVPSEWGLGESNDITLYDMVVANRSVLLRANPIDFDHGRMPVVVTAPNSDGFNYMPTSTAEILHGLQDVLDWLFNSHIANVRRAVNNRLIVDPQMINMRDLTDPKMVESGIIRLNRPAWGRGIKDYIHQLQIADVTRNHMSDAGSVMQGMDKAAGSNTSAMGALRQGAPERLTAKEFTGTQQGMYSRLEYIAKIIGRQLLQDMGFMFACNVQQFMSQPQYVSTVGRWQEEIEAEFMTANPEQKWNGRFGKEGKIKVSPFDLLVDFDLLVRDGSIPDTSRVQTKMALLQMVSQNPNLAQQFDSMRLVLSILREGGEKNAKDFIKVKADGAAYEEISSGNVIPLDSYRAEESSSSQPR